MSYIINYSTGAITLPLGQANTTGTSLTLVGRNWSGGNQPGYGQAINQNFVSMLENFTAATQPLSPLRGQLWYNTTTPNEIQLNTGTPASPVWQGLYSTGSNIDHIKNGSSNVFIPVAGGNVNTSVGGVPNVFIVTTTGAILPGTLTANTSVSSNILISLAPAGTPPFVVSSDAKVVNLNSEFLNGYSANASIVAGTIPVRDNNGNLTGNLSGNVTGTYGNFTSVNATTLSATNIGGILTTASQPNITSIGTLTTLTVTGTVTAGDISGGNLTLTGNLNVPTGSNVTAGNVITPGNVTAGNISTTGTLTVTQTITGGNIATTGNVVATGNLIGGNVSTSGIITAAGSITGGSFVTSGSVQTPTLTTGAAATPGSITGTWTLTPGSTLQATYADLAEYYVIDRAAGPGTVVEFGGTAEIRTCDTDMSRRVAGVVSTDPAFIMNSDNQQAGTIREAVALQGRVPCRVIGKTVKGDLMVSAGDGRARAEADPVLGSVLGKALENKDTDDAGIIEVAVGRL